MTEYRPVSPALVEQALLRYLRAQTEWVGYHQMIYRVSKGLRPKTYKKDGTKLAVFRCCNDLLKAGVIFRRKGRIGHRSCCRKGDYKIPDQVRINAVYSGSSNRHGRIAEVFQPTVASYYDGPASRVAALRSGIMVPYSA